MSLYSRDKRIFGQLLPPNIPGASPIPEDPMQDVKDLQSDLEFAIGEDEPGECHAVTSAQKTVKAVLAQLTALEHQNAELRGEVERLKKPVPEKMAPVQGYAPGIPWAMHMRAYTVYCKKYGPQEALITGWCRGGFGDTELDMFIPGWREEIDDRTVTKNEMATLRQQLTDAEADKARLDWLTNDALDFEFHFRLNGSVTKNFATGCVIRAVIDAAIIAGGTPPSP